MYVPIGGKKLLTFMDDFNMPAKDTFGSQPPLELMKLWLDYGFWYDREKQTQKYIKVSQSPPHLHPLVSCCSCFTSLPYHRHISPALEFSPCSKPVIYCNSIKLSFWILDCLPLHLFYQLMYIIYIYQLDFFSPYSFYASCKMHICVAFKLSPPCTILLYLYLVIKD